MYVCVCICLCMCMYVRQMFTRNLSVRTKVLVNEHDGGRNDPRLGIK